MESNPVSSSTTNTATLSMASSIPYVYTPLPTLNHTRIVELLPAAQQAAPLICRLVPLDLDSDDSPRGYEALSYTWGEPVFSEQLFIQGPDDENDVRMLHVTPSLASALRRLRRGNSTVRRIWADAVCINQDDNTEKGRQIPLMSNIYRGASRVVAWLDPGGDGGAEVRARRLNALIPMCSVRRETLLPKTLSEAAHLLEKHFAMPWFSRRWIIQEVVGHPDVELICGDEKTGWLPLMLMVTSVFREVGWPPAVVTSVLMMYDLWRMWVLGESTAGKCRLMNLLERFEHFACVDDRDRIYAITGLAEDGHGDAALVPISMDYTVSTEQLFTTFAEELVKAGHLSWVLQQACARRCTNTGLPSWVPDWRVSPVAKTLWEGPAEVPKWKASVEQVGSRRLHALTASICCLLTWEDSSAIRHDVSPLEVEWKNSKKYPPGTYAPDVREWILDTARRIRARELEGEETSGAGEQVDLGFSQTSGALQQLLVESYHRLYGRPQLGREELEKELDRYVSGADETMQVSRLVRDIGALMSGRCVFLCRVRSPPSTPSPGPAPTFPVMGIGPADTAVGDRVISFKPDVSRARPPGGGQDRSWAMERSWGQTYVVREQPAPQLNESDVPQQLVPQLAARVPGSPPGLVAFRLVGDCVLLRERLGSHEKFTPGVLGVQVSRAKTQLWI